MIRIGIIGCGSITIHRHAPEFFSNKDSEIVGFYDPKEDRALELSKKYKTKSYKTIENMLSEKKIDAVCVATSNDVHASLTIQALKSGKHVLCEKPMATSIEDAEKMISTAKETGKFLMIGHNQRLEPGHKRAKEILDSGEMGKILSFRTTFGHGGPEIWSADKGLHTWFFKKNNAFIGAMGDLGVHKADLIRWLIGDEIEEVKSYVSTLDKTNDKGELIEIDDNAVAVLKSKSGILGTLVASWTYYGDSDNSTVLYCSNGIMKIFDNPDYPISISKRNGEKVYYKLKKIQTNEEQSSSGIADAFIGSILTGTAPEISGEEGMAALKIVLACIKSQEENKTIKV